MLGFGLLDAAALGEQLGLGGGVHGAGGDVELAGAVAAVHSQR